MNIARDHHTPYIMVITCYVHRVWRLLQGSLSHELVTLIEADAPASLTNICESSNEKILVNTSHCSSTRNGDNVGLLIKTDSTQNE